MWWGIILTAYIIGCTSGASVPYSISGFLSYCSVICNLQCTSTLMVCEPCSFTGLLLVNFFSFPMFGVNNHCHLYPLFAERAPDIVFSAISSRRVAQFYHPWHFFSLVLASRLALQFPTSSRTPPVIPRLPSAVIDEITCHPALSLLRHRWNGLPSRITSLPSSKTSFALRCSLRITLVS